MRLTRSHVDLPLAPGAEVALPDASAQHLVRVLRLRDGDRCVLFNGDGNDYDAVLLETGKRGARARVTAARRVASESPLRVTLLQGIARGEKMDWILQKATELGVARIVPVASERSEVRLDADRAEKRRAHWRQVVVSACEQSGRAVVPPVGRIQRLDEAAADACGPAFVLDPFADASLVDRAASVGDACTLAVGPEGGWSDGDRRQLAAAGFFPARLGPRVLRTETAGISAIAILQALAGDVGR